MTAQPQHHHDQPDTDHFYLSRKDQSALLRILCEIHEWIVEELDNVITRQTKYADTAARISTGRRKEAPLPYNPKASDIAIDLHGTLQAWVEHVCTHRQKPWPGIQRADKYAKWLDQNIMQLAMCEQAEEAADEITDTWKRARSIIDRPIHRTYQGSCMVCAADLWALRADTEIVCDKCSTIIKRTDNDRRIDRALEARNYTATELVDIIYDRLGQQVKPKTIHDMAYRKTNPLLVRGQTYDRQNLYNAGEVFHTLRARKAL